MINNKKVIIIGSGMGALSSAVHLAAAGFGVTIFEVSSKTGGKMNELIADKFRFDLGPSVLTMPFVLKELFAFAGRSYSEYFKIFKIDPVSRNFFRNSPSVDTGSDVVQMAEQVSQLSSQDSSLLKSYFDYAAKMYENSADIFLFNPIHEIGRLVKMGSPAMALTPFKIDAFKTMHKRNAKFFESENIIKIFDRYATYNGSSPYLVPATLNMIAHVELTMGTYYVKGGMYRIAESLTELCRELGVRINLESEVEEILIEDKTAKGVKVNGSNIYSDYTIANSDVAYTLNKLIKSDSEAAGKYAKLEPSISGMLFLWGVRRKSKDMALHNVFFSDDYKAEFKQIFDNNIPPKDPTTYVSITSKMDRDHAPSGYENWYVLLNMPYLKKDIDWAFEKKRMKKKVIKRLKDNAIEIENDIVFENAISPEDLEKMYNTNRGSIYGISSNSRMSAFKRHPNRSRDFKNLYFCGGSVHPGGGVPLTLLSGRHAALLISENEGVEFKGRIK